MRVVDGHQQVRFRHGVQREQCPERMNAHIRKAIGPEQGLKPGHNGRILFLGQEPLRRQTHPGVRMFEGVKQFLGIRAGQLRQVITADVLVLNPVDAPVLVVAIRTDRGVARTVLDAADVVVRDRLVIEIEQIHRPIRADAGMHRAKPKVAPGDEFRLIAPGRLVGRILAAIKNVLMHDMNRRLANERAASIFFRPGAAFINGATAGRGEHPHRRDLHVLMPRVPKNGVHLLMILDGLVGGRVAQFAAGKKTLGHDHMADMRPVGLREEEFPLPIEVDAP